MKQFLFPYETVRNEQDQLIRDIDDALRNKLSVIAHAPTGLGKTVSTLGPALKIALEKGFKVFFVTPRHTQHKIAIETVKDIEKKFGESIVVADFIGKKWMCGHEGVSSLSSGQFADFCAKHVEERTCEFYVNSKNKDGSATLEAQSLAYDLARGLKSNEEVVSISKGKNMCPYEISSLLAQKAQVIVADYYHLIHPKIRTRFLRRCNASLENSIIIIDEAHNISSRSRDLLSVSLNGFVVNAARKEALESDDSTREMFAHIAKLFNKIESEVKDESKLTKRQIVDFIEMKYDYKAVIATLRFASDIIKLEKKQSFLGVISEFLEAWEGDDHGFVRIAKREGKKFSLNYRCMDPSLIISPLIEESYSTIAVSGTLEPLDMYANILGFPESSLKKSYKNPFEKKNRLNMVIPQTSTKYSKRSEDMYKKTAKILAEIVDSVPGNSAFFFPSYQIRDSVACHFESICKKSIFTEQPSLSKLEREDLLENFKSYKEIGAVLLGVISGSFGEGIDLPGDFLKCVVVVGVPLGKPDLETQELINYYDAKFKKGWDYGYILPAMSKVLQGAGRCIRSETDRGIIAFLDERFAWQNYYKAFPPDWDIKITGLYKDRIDEFFKL
jgi:DNA excision repair protein ERCC-2